jgi:hypothetical protein
LALGAQPDDPPADFEAHRAAHYAALREPLDPTGSIERLQVEMRTELAAAPRRGPRGLSVTVQAALSAQDVSHHATSPANRAMGGF